MLNLDKLPSEFSDFEGLPPPDKNLMNPKQNINIFMGNPSINIFDSNDALKDGIKVKSSIKPTPSIA